MYLSPVSDSKFSKSTTSSTPRPPHWRLRSTRNSKHRQRDRHPSICSDSETESSTAHAEELCLSVPSVKKWSLPLPVVTRGSESDSTSSSWSTRSADEGTEDEKSPIPSPSASTHSNEVESAEAIASPDVTETKRKKPKKISKAAETHKLQRMKTTNYGRCQICDSYVYFWGYQCVQCQLISHKKCLKKMTIMCAKCPLPPKQTILGMDITLSVERVPLLLIKCATEIERRSVTKPGIYRMTGVTSRVEKILKSFESGPHLIDVSDVSPNDLTSVLKEFLRELKYPLITNDIYKEFISIGRLFKQDIDCASKSKLINELRGAVNKLHPNHISTIAYLMHHLNFITKFHEKNNMTASCLGIIFAPTLFRPRDLVNDLYTEVFEAGPQARVIELMIMLANDVFGPPPQSLDPTQSSQSAFTFE